MMSGQPLFHKLYGPMLSSLPTPIRSLHNVTERKMLRGAARIEIGASSLAHIVSRILRFPPGSENVPLSLVMTPDENGERWERSFGDHKMTTHLKPGATPATVEEHLWPFVAISQIVPDSAGVDQVLMDLRFFALPLPRLLWPRITVREGSEGARYTFSMAIQFPWGAPLIRYSGWLETTALAPAEPAFHYSDRPA